jgi:hypothetical protein
MSTNIGLPSISIAFKELASTVAQRKLTSALYRPIYTDPRIGALAVEAPSSILILGNSFINSSNVGGILDEMIYNNNKSCDVRAISRGYATVDTYVNDSGLMSEISSGKYDIVFICGFYSIDEIENIYLDNTISVSNDEKYYKFTISTSVDLITPGLNKILGDPYLISVERIVPYA